MAKDTWTIIQDQITVMRDRNDRMDETVKFLQWDDDPYELTKPDGKTKLDDAISVTPNLPKVFAHSVISDLMGGKWQTVVEGNVSSRQVRYIEQFVDDNLAEADEVILDRYGIPSLFGWLCNHVCIRWAIGVRWIAWIENGEYKIDCQPVDMRWTPFVRGKWVAPISWRNKDELEQDLEEYERRAEGGVGEYQNLSLSTAKSEVRDYFDREKHELWVAGKLAYQEKNRLGYPPFVIVVPSSGFMLRDKDYLKHEGEDILFLNTGLYKELARSISLEQTLGYEGLFPGMEYETDTQDGKPAIPPPKIDETVKVKKGERHQPVPRGDINRAGQTARADIQQMISSGGPMSPREYNTPPSAVLLAGETELISRLQNSRKEALGIFRNQLARMIIKQFIALGDANEVRVGKQGMMGRYSVARMGNPDDYTITYHLSVKSKRQELANLAEFAAVYGKLPLKWNLSNILMADDPDGIINDLELERAKSINPALSLLEMAIKYARAAEETEDENEARLKRQQSKILTHEYVMAMRSRIAPATPPAAPKQIEAPKGNTQLLTSLVGGAMRGEAGQVKQAEEKV